LKFLALKDEGRDLIAWKLMGNPFKKELQNFSFFQDAFLSKKTKFSQALSFS